MRIRDVLWIEPFAEKNETRHGVSAEEVLEVFDRKPFITFREAGHVRDEDVYSALGRTEDGRYLAVFFIHKHSDDALILSARDQTATERRRYGKAKT